MEKRKFPCPFLGISLYSSFIQAIAHMLYQLISSSCHRPEGKMKERILDKYMVSSGRLVGSATRYNFILCLAQKLPIWNI
jgi:hypothetical protein